jgi:endoglucanase
VAIPELLQRLLTTPGPSGDESRAAAVWRDAASSFGEVSSNMLGSSWVRVPGTGGGPLLAVVGHIDEIGVVVTHVGDDGLIAVRGLGGWDANVLLGQRLEILTRDGAVAAVASVRRMKRKPGEDRKPIGFDDVYLDVGVKDGEEARGLVRPGDPAVVAVSPLELRNGRVASRSLDNRVGCYVALEVARRCAEAGVPGDVAGVAAVQEEVGDFAGSRTASWELEPVVAIAVDVTDATDVRGADPEEHGEHKLGSGAVLTRGPSMHPRVFELLHEAAEAESIPFTIEVTRGTTSTDADAVYVSRRGVATGLVSIPLRSMHTPVETVDLRDVEAAIAVIVAFAKRLDPGVSFAR